jgi:hypothetical protein
MAVLWPERCKAIYSFRIVKEHWAQSALGSSAGLCAGDHRCRRFLIGAEVLQNWADTEPLLCGWCGGAGGFELMDQWGLKVGMD